MASKLSSISSQSSIEKIREELSCSICFEQFQEPKMLPCFHTFCKECLEKTKRSSRGKLLCPTCRSQTPVKEVDEIGKLPNNFIVNRVLEALITEDDVEVIREVVNCTNCDEDNEAKWKCIDCENSLCISCYEAHNRMSLFKRTHTVVGLDSEDFKPASLEITDDGIKRNHCATHKEKELDLYCNDCGVCICTACFATQHQGHDLKNVEHAAEEQKADIRQLLLATGQKADSIQEASGEIDAMWESINQRHELLSGLINEKVSLITKAANQEANYMLRRLDNICKQRQKVLDAQRDELGCEKLKLESVQNFADKVLSSPCVEEVLTCKEQLLQQLHELNQHKDFIVGATDFFDVSFEVGDALTCIRRSNLKETDVIPGKTELVINNLPVEGKEVLLQVTTFEIEGHGCMGPSDNVEVIISSPSGGDTIPELNNTDCGEYSMTYIPQEPGYHAVCVIVRGQKAWKKPKQFYVSRNFMNIHHVRSGFGVRGDGKGEFLGLTGVAVNSSGQTAVIDSGNHCVQLFDADGNYLRMFGREGKKLGEMQYPRSGAFLQNGSSFVVLDSGNCKVLIFNENGDFLGGFGKFGSGNREFSCPLGLSIDGRGRMIVADSGNNRVQVFDPQGVFQLELGAEGPGKLKQPEAAIFSNGHFIVADTGNGCLKIFSDSGRHLETLKSINDHWFVDPCHVASDPNGFLVVCDRGSHQLKVLSPDRALVTVLSTAGSGPGQLWYPHASCVTTSGVIMVADWGNHRVQNFY